MGTSVAKKHQSSDTTPRKENISNGRPIDPDSVGKEKLNFTTLQKGGPSLVEIMAKEQEGTSNTPDKSANKVPRTRKSSWRQFSLNDEITDQQEKAKPKPQWTGWGVNNNGVHSTPSNGLEQIMQAEITVKTRGPSTQQHPQQNQSGVKPSKKSVWKSLDVHGTPAKSNAHLTVTNPWNKAVTQPSSIPTSTVKEKVVQQAPKSSNTFKDIMDSEAMRKQNFD